MAAPSDKPAMVWCEHAWCDQTSDAVEHGVVIELDDGRIGAIRTGFAAPPPGATVLTGLSMPAFANAHSHAFHRALRGRTHANGGDFWSWREVMYHAARRLTPDNYYQLAAGVFAELVTAGFGVVGEFHYVHHQPDGSPYRDHGAMGDALLAAADEAGIRITLLHTLYRHGGLDHDGYRSPDRFQHRFVTDPLDAAFAVIDSRSPTPMQRPGVAIHSLRALSPDEASTIAEWARERGVPLHMHASEQVAEVAATEAAFGRTPIEILDSVGALGPDSTIVHGTHLGPDDIELIAESGATVCICPTTERDLGDGIGATAELQDAGVPLSLGTDSHAVIDPFAEMQGLEMNQRLITHRRANHDSATLGRAATAAGYRCLGWDDGGRIEKGALADIATIRLDSIRTVGAAPDQLLAAAIFGATAADVSDVIVAGRHLVAEGRHRDIDVAAQLAASIDALFGEDLVTDAADTI